MTIDDRVYGRQEIIEPVLVKLVHSLPLRRLGRINMSGPSKFLYHWKDVSRLEHSLGVLLLLSKFKAPLAEQIAGLLHDIPHTAFSHVADYVFANKNHEFHEKFHQQMIMQSQIPQILKKYRIRLSSVLSHDQFR